MENLKPATSCTKTSEVPNAEGAFPQGQATSLITASSCSSILSIALLSFFGGLSRLVRVLFSDVCLEAVD